MGVVKGDWSSRAIKNKDVLGILDSTQKKRKRCMLKGIYNLRVKAILRSAEVCALTEMFLQRSEPEKEPEKKQPQPEDLGDIFGLDKLFEDMNDVYKSKTTK